MPFKKGHKINKGRRYKDESDYSYSRYHGFVYEKKGKANFCSKNLNHKAKRFEWANLSGNYKDVNDYISLCPSCHRKMDITDISKGKMRKAKLGKVFAAKSISQSNKNGILVKIFSSTMQASRETGISFTSINNCLKRLSKSAGGFIWSYNNF